MTKDLTGGSPLKVILFFTLPLVLGNLFQQFYALADTIIVGRFCGVSALASVGSTGSINYLILGFVIGICNGFAIPIAQLFGARDYSDLRRHVANAAWLCIAFSVVLTITTVTLTTSVISTIKVDCPAARSSEAPTRVKILSTSPILAALAGTNEPIWAINVMRAVWRSKADLPLMLGPVIMRICDVSESSSTSLAI